MLGQPWLATFLVERPGPIDRVVPIPPYHDVGEAEDHVDSPAAIAGFFATMAQERFDLAIQIHGGGGNSNPFVSRFGARHAAGLRAEGVPTLDRWLPYLRDQVAIVRHLEAVGLVGAVPVTLQPHLTVTVADRAEAAAVLVHDNRALVALHPGATVARRRWPAAHFAAIGDALSVLGARVVLVGDDSERVLTAAVAGLMSAPVEDRAGRLTLGGLLGLLARCHLAVGNDSGPLHLAEAVGTATVGIDQGQNLMRYGPPTRTRYRPVVSWGNTCPVCGRDDDAGCGPQPPGSGRSRWRTSWPPRAHYSEGRIERTGAPGQPVRSARRYDSPHHRLHLRAVTVTAKQDRSTARCPGGCPTRTGESGRLRSRPPPPPHSTPLPSAAAPPR